MSSAVNNEKKAQHQRIEEYKANETELKKKQAQEVTRLQKQQAQQVRDMQKTHQEQLESVRTRGQEALNSQDKKYQSEIEKIQSAHRQQTKNSAQEYTSRMRQVQDEHEGELSKRDAIHNTQRESSEKNYARNFEEKEKEYNQSVEYMRSKQEEGLAEQREKLESRYAKDSNMLRKTQDDKVMDLTQELQNTRDQKNAEIRDLKTRLVSDKEKSESDKLDLLQQEKKRSSLHQNYMGEQYEENLDQLRQKYQAYSMESKSGRAEELDNLTKNAEERTRDQVGNLERRMRNMKAEHEMQNFESNNAFREERKRYQDQNQQSLAVAENERSRVYEAANQKTKQEIRDVTKKNDQVLDRQNKYYQSRIQEMGDKYNESIETQVNALEVENKKEARSQDIRRQKVASLLTKEKNDLESYYQTMIDDNNRMHKEDLVEQRSNMVRERNEAVRSLEQRIREMDAKHSDKMNLQAQKYEKEILDLKDSHKAEKKSLVDQYSKRIDEVEKNQKFQVETSRIQSESREAQLKETYERQMETLRTKQEEERIRMATKRS